MNFNCNCKNGASLVSYQAVYFSHLLTKTLSFHLRNGLAHNIFMFRSMERGHSTYKWHNPHVQFKKLMQAVAGDNTGK